MTAADLAAALGGRRAGPGRWMARCPSHEDRTPSLSLTERAGRVLVYCFAGCRQRDVIEALRARGLWPERISTPATRRRWAKARQASAATARDAFAWRRVMLDWLDRAKAAAIDYHTGVIAGDVLELAAREHWALMRLDAAGVIAAYERAQREEPARTARFLSEGRRWLRACEAFGRRVVDEMAQEAEAA
jgi:hypothetical protein